MQMVDEEGLTKIFFFLMDVTRFQGTVSVEEMNESHCH